jgi:DivIVA domain-containing protein
MTDESFHLTALDVRRYDFGGKTSRGYDEKKVEDFRDQIVEELERLTRVNQELEAKARGFHEQLRAFRERDKALNDALVSAQQLRSDIREQAEREAQLILREARAEADRLLDGARAEIRRLEAELSALEKSRIAYIGQLRALVERQLAELNAANVPTPPLATRTGGQGEAFDEQNQLKTPAWLESLVKE